jgi:hypothetical protein
VVTPCPVDEVVVSVPQPLALARSVRSLSLLVSASPTDYSLLRPRDAPLLI